VVQVHHRSPVATTRSLVVMGVAAVDAVIAAATVNRAQDVATSRVVRAVTCVPWDEVFGDDWLQVVVRATRPIAAAVTVAGCRAAITDTLAICSRVSRAVEPAERVDAEPDCLDGAVPVQVRERVIRQAEPYGTVGCHRRHTRCLIPCRLT
jgi:hypothetical protein